MSSLDSWIDDLYRGPLDEFVSARTALAKTLTGTDAKLVRKLPKPTLVPWAVNQVYWHARAVFDRLTKSGQRVRQAQIAVLEGAKDDVRAATDTHRRSIADAVREAERLAGIHGLRPGKDGLMQTFEGLSLATTFRDPPGRLTRPMQPSGFEALAGVAVKAPPLEMRPLGAGRREANTRRAQENASRKEAAAQKKRETAVRKAEAAFERAKRRMDEAAAALKRSRGQTS